MSHGDWGYGYLEGVVTWLTAEIFLAYSTLSIAIYLIISGMVIVAVAYTFRLALDCAHKSQIHSATYLLTWLNPFDSLCIEPEIQRMAKVWRSKKPEGQRRRYKM